MQLRTLVGVAALLALASPPDYAAAQGVSAVRVEYEKRSATSETGWTVVETGTHMIADDGRYRLDRVVAGERTTRIHLPDRGERIDINHSLGVGVRGPLTGAFAVPAEKPLSRMLRGGADDTSYLQRGQSMTAIGTRQRGPLLLQGFSLTAPCLETWNCYVEVWIHAPQLDGQPQVLERTLTQTGADGSVYSNTTIVSSERTSTGNSTFAPPAGIAIENRW